jgi:hypothetical protein
MIFLFLNKIRAKMFKYILIFLGSINFAEKCDEIIEYSTEMYQTDQRMIPDDYIEEIKYWVGRHISKFSDFQTYPDNWGCFDKEIVSFIFKQRYCEISEMKNDAGEYIAIRIYPSNVRCAW